MEADFGGRFGVSGESGEILRDRMRFRCVSSTYRMILGRFGEDLEKSTFSLVG